LFRNAEQNSSLSPIYPFNARAYLGLDTTEDPALFTRLTHDSFSTRVLASLLIAATVMIGSLGHAVANIQVVA
jgi:hypothetical protein